MVQNTEICFAVYDTGYTAVSSFSRPNFNILNLGVHPKWVHKRKAPPLSTAKIGPIISNKRCHKLLLLINRKSHTGFPLVPKSATLNDLDRCNGRYFALVRWIRYGLQLTVWNWLKLDTCNKNVAQRIDFGNRSLMKTCEAITNN